MSMRITDQHLEHWREHGYVVVPDFLTADELEAAHRNLRAYFPTREELDAEPLRYRNLQTMVEFPYVGDALNDITMHAELVTFAERALGTSDIMLSGSLLWAKYAVAPAPGERAVDTVHADYPAVSLVYPRPHDRVSVILYYSDVTSENGPTYVYSSLDVRGGSPIRPELNSGGTPIHVAAGSLLIKTITTFHRGSALRSGARFTHHMGYRAASDQWLWYAHAQRLGATSEMQRFITRASPRQRALLGFPPPGHGYWNPETIEGTAAMYPGIDMSVYA